MSKVIQLTDNGIAPSLRAAAEIMQAGMWDAIDQAAEQGMPIGLIIGQLEFIKAAMINRHFKNMEGD